MGILNLIRSDTLDAQASVGCLSDRLHRKLEQGPDMGRHHLLHNP